MLARRTLTRPSNFLQGAMDMRHYCVLALATFVLAMTGMIPLEAARASEQDELAVKQATHQFYAALNAMFEGHVEPMEAVWSHADDITYMGPDGKYIVGWDQLLPNWKSQAAMMLGGTVLPEQIHNTIGQSLATVQCFEVGENMVDGKPVKVLLRATNIFRKESGDWKMIGHHTDKLDFLEQ
jgi:ketosteroid isomerase-like protein